MDSKSHLIQKISHSIKTNKVVLVCTSGSVWQNEFVAGIVANRNCVDLSDSMVREQSDNRMRL